MGPSDSPSTWATGDPPEGNTVPSVCSSSPQPERLSSPSLDGKPWAPGHDSGAPGASNSRVAPAEASEEEEEEASEEEEEDSYSDDADELSESEDSTASPRRTRGSSLATDRPGDQSKMSEAAGLEHPPDQPPIARTAGDAHSADQ